MSVFSFFAVGPMELLILGLLCLGSLAGIVVLVVVLSTSRKGRGGATANPNLYPCPDCGRFVSRQAPNCPQCGRPLTGEGDRG
jgi:hypothetical protein